MTKIEATLNGAYFDLFELQPGDLVLYNGVYLAVLCVKVLLGQAARDAKSFYKLHCVEQCLYMNNNNVLGLKRFRTKQ